MSSLRTWEPKRFRRAGAGAISAALFNDWPRKVPKYDAPTRVNLNMLPNKAPLRPQTESLTTFVRSLRQNALIGAIGTIGTVSQRRHHPSVLRPAAMQPPCAGSGGPPGNNDGCQSGCSSRSTFKCSIHRLQQDPCHSANHRVNEPARSGDHPNIRSRHSNGPPASTPD